MSVAPKYYVQVLYNGVNISNDISNHLLNLSYTDQVHGQSDEIEISLEDGDAKWRNEWYPKKKDLLTVSMGPDQDSAFDCGVFWIDEIEASGPPDVLIIRGLATGAKGVLNTKKSSAHEGKSLKDIATTIAKNNGLTIDDGGFNNTSRTPYNLKMEAASLRLNARVLTNLVPLSDLAVQHGLVGVQQDLDKIRTSLTAKKADKQLAEVKKLMNSLINLYAGLDISDGTSKGKRDIALYNESSYASRLATEFYNASGITVQTNIKSGVLDGIVINRSTQNHETDLGFLKRLCNEYGIIFAIRNATLFFTTVFKLEDAPSAFTLNRNQLKSYSFKDKVQRVYSKAKVKHHNPAKKEVIEAEYSTPEKTNADGETFTQETSDDVLVIHSKAETKEQADIKAQAALHSKNSKAKEGSITLEGTPETVLILAGNNFDLEGNGILSGKYHVITSTHTLNKSSGYEISAEIKSVGTVLKSKNKSEAIAKTLAPSINRGGRVKNVGFADGLGLEQNGITI